MLCGEARPIKSMCHLVSYLKVDTCVPAGDPNQLGPVVKSTKSRAMGLDVSLIEKLLATGCYSANVSSDASVMLTRNYR